jgi:anti-anti-sigma regulatory factor
MANNFKMSLQKQSESLHIRLSGDFDGTSAHQLLRTLRNHSRTSKRILISTGSLKEVHLFGKNVFHKNLEFLNGQACDVRFTGKRASEFTSEGSMLN